VPASFKDQLAIVEELLGEVARMEAGERRSKSRRERSEYERELRLAGLAQRVAQAYTMIEGVLAFVARRIDGVAVTGNDWHKALIARCSTPFGSPERPAVISTPLAEDLLELCEFRHVVRNVYPTRLDEVRVRDNLERLIHATRAFGEACERFAARTAPTRTRPRTSRRPRR
jgi:hypothetical protein